MRPNDPLEGMLREMRYKTAADRRQRILTNILDAMDESPRLARSGPWRTILTHRSAQLAAAAVLVAALVLISLLTGPLDGTTTAYARITKAVQNVPWMHMRYSGYTLDDAGNRTSAEGQRDTEVWYSFNAQVVIYKYGHGRIVYYDYAKQEIQVYNPVAKRIVVSALPAGRQPFRTDSPWGWLEKSIEQITSFGGDVTRRIGRHKGQEVEIFEIASAVRPGVAAIRSKVYVDRTTSLPIAEERTYINTNTGNPQLVETGTFDYPEEGPADIYGLGLARDIPTINNLPLPSWWDINPVYESHRFKAPAERYIAVVTREMIGLVESVEICYADGPRFREERHFLYHRGLIGPQWEEQKAEFGGTLDSILKWSRAYKAYGQISISLFGRGRLYTSRRDEDGVWTTGEQTMRAEEWTEEEFWHLCPIGELGWPDIRGYADIIQDDFARENDSIRVDAQGGVFYLNPDRDHICQRKIDADGNLEEVMEFGRTATGQWYPKRVEGSSLNWTIYLDTDPNLPDGLFDPNNLPK